MKVRSFIAGLAVASVFTYVPATASAAVLVFNLDYEFSGGTAPAGTSPWVRATFEDLVGGGVRLTISNLGLTASEINADFYFNFNPAKNAASVHSGISLPGTGTHTAWDFYASGNNAWKADGDGFFDFNINFPPPGDDVFTAGETFVLEFAASTGVTTADFNFPSVDGPVGKTGFYAAAHIQRIGSNAQNSGWIGARGSGNGGGPGNSNGNDVPEPATLALIGLGALAIGALRRRRGDRAG